MKKTLEQRSNEIANKVKMLSPQKKSDFCRDLRDVYESVGLCRDYGAKDPVNLPQEDVIILKETIYNRYYSS